MTNICNGDPKSAQAESSLWNYAEGYAQQVIQVTKITTMDLFLGRIFRPIFIRNGLCMENFLPKNFIGVIGKINNLLLAPRNLISNLFKLNPYQTFNCIAPVLEEFQFRYLLQQKFLRDIPQTILDKVFPDQKIDMNALPLKALRALLVASIFTVLHYQYAPCSEGGGVETFVGSLLYSALVESGESAIFTANLHLMWNQFGPVMNSLLDVGIEALQ